MADAEDAEDAKPGELPATIQAPHAAVLDPDAPTGANAVVGAATMVTLGAPSMPIGAPPEMPADWRYTVHDEIARGGMGRVVEATDTVLGRTVAVKEALSLDPDAVRRFQRETRITARLEHPSIVPVHDAGITPAGSPFYVMRKISGRPLEELVGTTPEVSDRLALVPHIVAAAHAVAHAHERGIVHRDIKPANILVGDAGETIMIDWGLAKAIGETDDAEQVGSEPRNRTRSHAATAQVVLDDDEALKTRAGIVFGTPGFMAPEQLRGAPVDERGDVYALGATLYHLLARRPPHYSKNPGEMMRAAAEGPPPPLRELAPGVPPELATIVDKALAYDRTHRYQNAGGLADDLQRFLTGQLVASHHYSPRERIVRFVRQNRALVGVTTAATLALLVGGALAINRIVAARDHAAEEARIAVDEKHVADAERAKAVDSLEQLTLADARTKATEEPTRAVALVRPLVASGRWREARDVAAAARAQGVAFAMQASPHTLSLELSRDGLHALAAGDDGIVRIYDLVKRTSRIVGDAKAPILARFGDAEHTVVWFRDNHITLVDVASGSHRDVMTPTAIVKLEVSGPIAYWTDPQQAVWKLDLAGGPPQKLAVDEPVETVAPSPDGRWIALGGKTHLMLIDRTDSTLPPEVVTEGTLHDIAWAADGTHVVALIDDLAIDVDVDPSPTIIHKIMIGKRNAVAYSTGRIFSSGPTGVAQLSRDDTRSRATGGDYTLGIHQGRGTAVIAGRPLGVLVLSDDGDRMLASPLRLARVETAASGPFVVGAADNHLLIWNLDDVLPRHLGDAPPSGAGFVTGDTLIATFVDSPAQWIDLRTDKSSPLGMIAGLSAIVPAPDGQRAVVIDGLHHGRLCAAVGDPVDLGELDRAAFVDDQRLVLATPAGALQLQHGATLVQRIHPVTALAANATGGGWIAAAFADKTLWRTNLEAKATTTLAVAAATPPGAFALGSEGDVVFGAGSELHVWSPDGKDSAIATFGKAIASVAFVDRARLLVITSDGTAAVVPVKPPNDFELLALPIVSPSLTSDGLVAAQSSGGGVEIVDPAVKERWPVGAPRGLQLGSAQVSFDGRRVLALTSSGLLVWPLALPADAAATTRWIDALTNAIADHGPSAPLDWR